jgi:hypothetical protein
VSCTAPRAPTPIVADHDASAFSCRPAGIRSGAGAQAVQNARPATGHRPRTLCRGRKLGRRGVGGGLLKDAVRRSIQAAEVVGACALLCHAIDDEAKAFLRQAWLRRIADAAIDHDAGAVAPTSAEILAFSEGSWLRRDTAQRRVWPRRAPLVTGLAHGLVPLRWPTATIRNPEGYARPDRRD